MPYFSSSLAALAQGGVTSDALGELRINKENPKFSGRD
jgi:hypothetical protein